MSFRKIISLWALLALVMGQIALSQHSAAHIDHGFAVEHTAALHMDDHHSDHENNKHECPECSLTKSLQTAFYNAPALFISAVDLHFLTPPTQVNIVNGILSKANPPRAPPTFLI